MNSEKITELYHFLSSARLTKMSDDEKIAVIRLMRRLKPIATALDEALADAREKASSDDHEKLVGLYMRLRNGDGSVGEQDAVEAANYVARLNRVVSEAVKDVASLEHDIDKELLTAEATAHLINSNDWKLSQIMWLEETITQKERRHE